MEYIKSYGTGKGAQIYERLQKSSYVLNENDYVFLKCPFKNEEFPCDFKIAPLVRWLWELGITTFGSNQPEDSINDIGYITFSPITSDEKQSIDLIMTILPKENVKMVTEMGDGENIKKSCFDYDKQWIVTLRTKTRPFCCIYFIEVGMDHLKVFTKMKDDNSNKIIKGFSSCF
jgi:hypothetical protein